MDPSGHYWVKFSSIKKKNDRIKHVIMKRYNKNKSKNISSYIKNQNKDDFTEMKFGAYNVDYNGCGAIAAYNLFIMLGKKRNFAQILAEFDYNCVGGKNEEKRCFFTYVGGCCPDFIINSI